MEKLMQYVWQHRLWKPGPMTTTDGRRVMVIDPGLLNTDSGPDFFNAKVSIDGHTWAGNVEIHVRASDWYRHGHDRDHAYDTVILHVVGRDDISVTRPGGETIPQVAMPCSPDFERRYHRLVDNASTELPCAATIANLPPIYTIDWLDSLAHQRLYDKTDRILSRLAATHGDWEETCYVTIARALGFGINSDAFERLAVGLPLRFMGKHSDSPTAVEALLFGQSGLLDEAPSSPYADRLRKEYAFLSDKFSLSPLRSPGWRMARMRPQNFPHRRIAFLASLIAGGFKMMERMTAVRDLDEARTLFAGHLTGYWARHYSFNPIDAGRDVSAMSRSSIDILIINAVVPLMYARGLHCGDDRMRQRAITLLQSVPSERNSIVELFVRAGVMSPDAFTSQALIQLRRAYCETRKCLYCRIGHRMLAASATIPAQ
ncbi:MAG: DUF2851 family protein [Pseudoflavonifractor sp.]|nr:DUF2851 family protein [Pseudoflavonifractor sp.]